MRAFSLLAILAMAATAALAQQAAPQAVNPGQVDAVLDGWERSLTSLRSLYADCERTTLDKVFQTREVFKGTAKYLKALAPGQGSRASLDLHKWTAKGLSNEVYEKYVCTGTYVYAFAPAEKVIRVYDQPKANAGDNFQSFVFGMKASEAKQRYELTIPTKPADKYYYYVDIRPKLAQDKADFTVARLVIRRDNFLPAQVWFLRPNGNQETWTFPKVGRDVAIPATTFEQPRLLPGWKIQRMPAQTKLKIRGNGP